MLDQALSLFLTICKYGLLVVTVCLTTYFIVDRFQLDVKRRYSFSYECLVTEQAQKFNFDQHQPVFKSLIQYAEKGSSISINDWCGQYISITFGSDQYDYERERKSHYVDEDSEFSLFENDVKLSDDGRLEIFGKKNSHLIDDHNTIIYYKGNISSPKLATLLTYYGWSLKELKSLISHLAIANCTTFSTDGENYETEYFRVRFFQDHIIRCGTMFRNAKFTYRYEPNKSIVYDPWLYENYGDDFYAGHHWHF